MKLFELIKSWFDGSDKPHLDHFDLSKIEEVISNLKDEPILKFMQQQCEEFLQNVALSLKDKNKSEKKFYIINGVSGSGKTNFLHEYLQDFLIATNAIKKRQDRIAKIANKELSEKKLHGKELDDLINQRTNIAKDGMLILDEFNIRNKNANVIANLIDKLYKDSEFNNTAIVLMGEYRNNSAFLQSYNLDNIFPMKFRLNFYTPSFNQIGDIFEVYAKREGDFTLTDKAKASLIFYFSKLKLIKAVKANLDREGTMKFSYPEKHYEYTSEMFPVYRQLVAIKKDDREIDQQDIFVTNTYKALLADLDKLEKYCR